MAKKAAKGAAAKKKRTVSGRRGKPGRKNNQGTDTRGVVGIVVFCIGFLALLCQFIPSDGGFLNRCMLVVRGLGGMLCLLLPVVLCWTGAVLVFFREKKWSTRTLILGSLIFLFVEAMFQLFRISGRERGAGRRRRGSELRRCSGALVYDEFAGLQRPAALSARCWRGRCIRRWTSGAA